MGKGIAWIGFGEAAYHIARGLRENHFERMAAYDPARDDPLCGETIRSHAADVQVSLCESQAQAVEGMDFIISLTSAKVAPMVAGQILPLMREGQIFLDFNSAAPNTKQSIATLPRPAGVRICDVAVMGPVPINGCCVPLLITGEGKEDFAQEMVPYGMCIELLDAPLGGASAVKMIRSVFMKGFPQVMLECLLAAERYGVTEKIFDSIEATIEGKSLRQLADQLFTPTVVHAARRASEMGEVVQMLQSIGMESSMSQAAAHRLSGLASLHIVDEIGSDVKPEYRKMLEIILAHLDAHHNISERLGEET